MCKQNLGHQEWAKYFPLDCMWCQIQRQTWSPSVTHWTIKNLSKSISSPETRQLLFKHVSVSFFRGYSVEDISTIYRFKPISASEKTIKQRIMYSIKKKKLNIIMCIDWINPGCCSGAFTGYWICSVKCFLFGALLIVILHSSHLILRHWKHLCPVARTLVDFIANICFPYWCSSFTGTCTCSTLLYFCLQEGQQQHINTTQMRVLAELIMLYH